MKRWLTTVFLLALCAAVLPARAEAVLDNILKSGSLKLGYREQSPPFSFLGAGQRPQGYSIEGLLRSITCC